MEQIVCSKIDLKCQENGFGAKIVPLKLFWSDCRKYWNAKNTYFAHELTRANSTTSPAKFSGKSKLSHTISNHTWLRFFMAYRLGDPTDLVPVSSQVFIVFDRFRIVFNLSCIAGHSGTGCSQDRLSCCSHNMLWLLVGLKDIFQNGRRGPVVSESG